MKVACIGNALVDKVCLLENEAILTEENLPKGSMQLINSEESKRLQQTFFIFFITPIYLFVNRFFLFSFLF